MKLLFLFFNAVLFLGVQSFAFAPRLSSSSRAQTTKLNYEHDSDPVTATAATFSKSKPKVCVITGSSQGLGKAMALELARYGQKVVVNYFPGLDDDAQIAVEEINQAGGEGFAVPADITNSEQIDEMFHKIVERFGRVDGEFYLFAPSLFS
jgi:hypothetical protein